MISTKDLKRIRGTVFVLATIGAILLVWGAVYTMKTVDTVGTYYGYPIWNPPIHPADATVSADYLLNYLGMALLTLAAVVAFESRRIVG